MTILEFINWLISILRLITLHSYLWHPFFFVTLNISLHVFLHSLQMEMINTLRHTKNIDLINRSLKTWTINCLFLDNSNESFGSFLLFLSPFFFFESCWGKVDVLLHPSLTTTISESSLSYRQHHFLMKQTL